MDVDTPTEATSPVEAAPAAPGRQRSYTEFNYEAGAATTYDKDGAATFTMSLEGVEDAMLRRLALRGMVYLASQSGNPDQFALTVMAGTALTERTKEKATPAKPWSMWREAITQAIVEQSKKRGTPVVYDEARAKVVEFTTSQVHSQKADPTVVKHYAKLKTVEDGAAENTLLEMAGL